MSTSVFFGNVSISELQKIAGVTFSTDDRDWLEEHHSEYVDYNDNQFHIFSLPSVQIHCGPNIMDELIRRLSAYDYSQAIEPFMVRG